MRRTEAWAGRRFGVKQKPLSSVSGMMQILNKKPKPCTVLCRLDEHIDTQASALPASRVISGVVGNEKMKK